MHREIAVNLIRPYLKKTDAKKSLQQLYALPWDNKTILPKKNKPKKDPVDFWSEIDKRTKKKSS
ncbi:MAG TPA: hypothetical protein VFM70_02685 [Salinimicrobium sp.]|nr:hypothetical protein [Salinimicrobium sp.]